MFAYKTNSPDYLDYIASVKSREEILADPKLCVLLENPYIKENMEVALAWRKAKFGDYKDKYDFVEYYLCNGPELDADTLLHYRAEASADPVVMEIAYSYFNDTSVLSEIRETKYNKKKSDDNEWWNCFTNPCFYLGDFSGVMGSMGDSHNVETFWSNMAERWNSWHWSDKAQEANLERRDKLEPHSSPLAKKLDNAIKGGATSAVQGAASAVASAAGLGGKEVLTPKDGSNPAGQGPTVQATMSKVQPSATEGWWEISKLAFSSDKEFVEKFQNKYMGSRWHMPKFGDVMAGTFSDAIALTDKAHVARQLGDCYRLWSQVRRLSIFGEGNKVAPITSDALVEFKQADGNPAQIVGVTHPKPADATAPVKRAKTIKDELQSQAKSNKKADKQQSSASSGTTSDEAEAKSLVKRQVLPGATSNESGWGEREILSKENFIKT